MLRHALHAALLAAAAACSTPPCPPAPLESPFIRGATPEVIVSGRQFTEGPLWMPGERRLVFSDIPAGELLAWSPSGGTQRLRAAEAPNGNALDPNGAHVTCLHGSRRVVRWDDGEPTLLVERTDTARLNSPNDLVFAADGTLWFTDPPWGLENERVGRELPGNFVHRLDPGAQAAVPVLRGLAMPNGIALSPDGRTLYVSDTGGRPSHPDPSLRALPARVHAFDVVGSRLASETPRWSIDARSDGMCVDRDGRLYLTGEQRITVWSAGGELLAELPLADTPSNVCFGGERLDTLFVTARSTVLRIPVNAVGHRLAGQ